MSYNELFSIYDNGSRLLLEKDKVGIFFHPADSGYTRSIINDIFEVYDCTIYCSNCREESLSGTELESLLEEMNLIVFIVSRSFLSSRNPAKDYVLDIALRCGMKIMPVQVEEGIERLFDQTVGSLQIIKRGDTHYKENLKAFIDQRINLYHMIGLSDEQKQLFNNIFSLKGFVSYRKKNHLQLTMLLKELRSYRQMLDVSLWYDNALYPGEDFNDQISEKLSDSDFVLFVATPELLEPGNYVLECEYKQAVIENKQMFAVFMKETDPVRFRMAYPLLQPVYFGDIVRIVAAIESMKALNGNHRSGYSADHLYMLACAYQEGNGTERNVDLSYKLFVQAAELGHPYAMLRIAQAIDHGYIIAENHDASQYWRKRAAELLYEQLKGTPETADEAASIASSLFRTADEILFQMVGDPVAMLPYEEIEEAGHFAVMLQETMNILLRQGVYSSSANPGILYLREGQRHAAAGNIEHAAYLFEQAEQNFTALITALGENKYLMDSISELKGSRLRTLLWDYYTLDPVRYQHVFDFPGGLVPAGQWGERVSNYNASAYRCPYCGNRLYRTVFPEGREPKLFIRNVKKQFIDPARVFVCPCGTFFATERGHRLRDLAFIQFRIPENSDKEKNNALFNELFEFFDELGDIYAQRKE